MDNIYEFEKNGDVYTVIFDSCYILKKNEEILSLAEDIDVITNEFQAIVNRFTKKNIIKNKNS